MSGDPSEWPSEFPEMREIDNLLRCGVCYELMDTAMIVPSCSHNYCSLCIRRYMSFKTQCPTCRINMTDLDLKNNRTLDELISHFKTIRPRLLAILSKNQQGMSSEAGSISNQKTVENEVEETKGKKLPARKRNARRIISDDDNSDDDFSPPPKKQPSENKCAGAKEVVVIDDSSSMDSNSTKEKPVNAIVSNSPFFTASSSPSPSSNVKKVNCPVCGVPVNEKYVNLHLDRCLNSPAPEQSRASTSKKRKQLPKLVYTLMKDNVLRKKLSEHGLSTQGDRRALIKRHQEFTLLYNTQCDSLNPKSAQEIAREMSKSSSLQMFTRPSTSKASSALVIEKGASAEQIETAQKQYVEQHKSQFDKLIAETKARMKRQKAESQRKKKEEEEQKKREEENNADLTQDETRLQNNDTRIALPGGNTDVLNGRETHSMASVHAEPPENTQHNEPVQNFNVPSFDLMSDFKDTEVDNEGVKTYFAAKSRVNSFHSDSSSRDMFGGDETPEISNSDKRNAKSVPEKSLNSRSSFDELPADSCTISQASSESSSNLAWLSQTAPLESDNENTDENDSQTELDIVANDDNQNTHENSPELTTSSAFDFRSTQFLQGDRKTAKGKDSEFKILNDSVEDIAGFDKDSGVSTVDASYHVIQEPGSASPVFNSAATTSYTQIGPTASPMSSPVFGSGAGEGHDIRGQGQDKKSEITEVQGQVECDDNVSQCSDIPATQKGSRKSRRKNKGKKQSESFADEYPMSLGFATEEMVSAENTQSASKSKKKKRKREKSVEANNDESLKENITQQSDSGPRSKRSSRRHTNDQSNREPTKKKNIPQEVEMDVSSVEATRSKRKRPLATEALLDTNIGHKKNKSRKCHDASTGNNSDDEANIAVHSSVPSETLDEFSPDETNSRKRRRRNKRKKS